MVIFIKRRKDNIQT